VTSQRAEKENCDSLFSQNQWLTVSDFGGFRTGMPGLKRPAGKLNSDFAVF
jgi:hypothetical protein